MTGVYHPANTGVTLNRGGSRRDYLEFVDELGLGCKIELNPDDKVFRVWYTDPVSGAEVMVRRPGSAILDAPPHPDSFEDEEDRALAQTLYDQYLEGQLMEPGYVTRLIRKLGWKPASEANKEAAVARVEKIRAQNERDSAMQENTNLHTKVIESNAEIKKLKMDALAKEKRIRELEHQLSSSGGPILSPKPPHGPSVPRMVPYTPQVGSPTPNSSGPVWVTYTTNNTGPENQKIAREALKRLPNRER